MKTLWKLAHAALRIAAQTGSYDSYGEWEGEVPFTFSHGTRAQNRVIRRAVKAYQDSELLQVDQLAGRKPGRILQKLKNKRKGFDDGTRSFNCCCLVTAIDPALIQALVKDLVEGSQAVQFFGSVDAQPTMHGLAQLSTTSVETDDEGRIILDRDFQQIPKDQEM